jgi:predicted ATP-grasp superfamily ATP-dependent carboligase
MKAIIITDDHYNGLGVVRSLGEESVYNILVILSTENTFIEKSKYVREVYKIEPDENELLLTINEIVNNEDEYYLFPLSDYSASILDKNYNKFSKNVITPNIAGEMDKYLDKNYIKKIALKNGLYVPRSIVVESNSISISEWDIFPSILKPVKSIEGKKIDIVKVDNYESLIENINIYKKKGYSRILIEEFVAGENEHMIEVMGYCKKDKRPVICGVIKKIREYPIQNGSTSYAKIVDNHEGLNLTYLTNFLKDISYFGLFDVEFKYANGIAYFIECNFRNGAPGYAFTYNSRNIPFLWLSNNDGTTFRTMSYKNRYFMCEQYDIINMIKGHVSFMEWIKAFIKSKKIFFDLRDWKPNLFYYYHIFLQKMNK